VVSMAIDYQILGNRIKAQRIIKGTTQEHFAEHLDVSVGYISQIERGITKVSLDRLSSISEYLDCDMSILLEGVSSGSENYLDKDFNNLYKRLSAYEKKILTALVKEYIDVR